MKWLLVFSMILGLGLHLAAERERDEHERECLRMACPEGWPRRLERQCWCVTGLAIE